MLKDVDRMKESGNINEDMLGLLGGYIDALTTVLEDNEVDIYYCCTNNLSIYKRFSISIINCTSLVRIC